MEKLIEILNNIRDDVDYETCDTLIDDGIYVSFDIISLVAALCEEYDIDIGAEELIPENFNSAKALYEMVQRLIEEQN
ncbi:MAG: acyl carrier protein [Oscillospiraceae bacterium]|jgi:acyl carrier protein|nr:acyl carrier protein [Oscillospiraceae bacterium]